MVKNIAAQLGLLAFALALFGGLYAGNSVMTILLRSLAAMIIGALLGQLLGAALKSMLREHLQRKKLSLDQKHAEAVRAMDAATESDPIEVR